MLRQLKASHQRFATLRLDSLLRVAVRFIRGRRSLAAIVNVLEPLQVTSKLFELWMFRREILLAKGPLVLTIFRGVW